MKAITIPSGIRGHLDTEIIRDLFCVHSRPEGHTGELNLLHMLMSSLAMPAWAPRVPERDINILESLYEISSNRVASFLIKNDFLVDLLNEAVPKLQECFGDDVSVRLEVFSDPTATNNCELFARVLTKLSANDALDILDRFDNEWWSNASSRSQGLLSFALRYV
jgi:hypothetical protein